MNTIAISVNLPETQVETARQAVIEGRAESLSAYISDALYLAAQRDQLSRLLDDMKQELTP
jgi:Arc/MetJ-type ribon-helix-helix transcriptional regulator